MAAGALAAHPACAQDAAPAHRAPARDGGSAHVGASAAAGGSADSGAFADLATLRIGPDSTHPRAAGDTATVSSDGSGPFFYHDRGYGTDAYAGPFDVLLNKGFAVAQWEGKGRNVLSYPYGWRAVWRSLTRPDAAVQRAGGWKKVLLRHAVPFYSDNVRSAQWVPNYFGHILEGGIAYRRLAEWNRARGVPLPGVVAGLTTYLAAIVNEAYETPLNEAWVTRNGTAGSVMDLYVFDPLGIFLFHRDDVSRFFATRLGATIWPTQASLSLTDGLLVNNGESLVLKLPLFFTRRARFFVRSGMGYEMGLSFRRAGGIAVSVGVGKQSRTRWLDPFTQVENADMAWSGGIWVDRDNALLFSLTLDQATDRRVAVNVFPGLLRFGSGSFGAWFVVDAAGTPYLGVSGSKTLGLGLGVGF